MISFLNKNNKLNETKNSLNITYPRDVNIIFGHYPYPDKVHNMILEIKNNIDPEMDNYTAIKGRMTNWKHFIGNDLFEDFFRFLINTHQVTHPEIFAFFLERSIIIDAWGNEIRKGDSIDVHDHRQYHAILYLTDGADLILPELNIKITPKAGDYYIFPPLILHGFEKNDKEENRYSLVCNFDSVDHFFVTRKLEQLYDKKREKEKANKEKV
tara:strand:- start:347 stop:982 length:636 start_codon:yes stop_codon:yes gene_type:complete